MKEFCQNCKYIPGSEACKKCLDFCKKEIDKIINEMEGRMSEDHICLKCTKRNDCESCRYREAGGYCYQLNKTISKAENCSKWKSKKKFGKEVIKKICSKCESENNCFKQEFVADCCLDFRLKEGGSGSVKFEKKLKKENKLCFDCDHRSYCHSKGEICGYYKKETEKEKKESYYDIGGISTIDKIKAKLPLEQYKGFLLGNVIKYSCRLNHKNQMKKDAKKLADYSKWLFEIL